MKPNACSLHLEQMKKQFPDKFISEDSVFSHIHPGDRIFVGTGCGEPQYLVGALIKYVESNPKAFFDAEVLQVWTLGVAPYADEKFKDNFRQNSFFIGESTRAAVAKGMADYTPIFLSALPELFHKKRIPIDVALIQTSPPDEHGYMSLGISVDIVKAAAESASLVIVQVNSQMPWVHGDTFIHIKDIDFIIPHDENLLEFGAVLAQEIPLKIGKYVARLIEDGDTIQVGYGSIPNAILSSLSGKKNLGVHSELLSDGIAELMKSGVINNSAKTLNRGKTIAAFCMGHKVTYDYLHDNPSVEFQPVDYTNNPLVIARINNMVAVNSALEIDLTGQATAESLGKVFYSGIGGQADFMRGAILSPGGKTILALESTANNDTVSRIVPFLKEGAGVTLNRGDIHYVATEYGIAYLHAKNIRERAMELIAIAHPKFRTQLIQDAKKLNLIYQDQAFIPGKKGEYPEHLEAFRTTNKGFTVFFRPVKISDEPLLKDFFYSLSNQSMYRRFISQRKDMPHERLQDFTVIDYDRTLEILAIIKENGRDVVVGVGQYGIDENTHTAEIAFAVNDDYQNKGVGRELLSYLTFLGKKQGLLGFTAEVLEENKPMLHLFETMCFNVDKRTSDGVCELKMAFRNSKSDAHLPLCP